MIDGLVVRIQQAELLVAERSADEKRILPTPNTPKLSKLFLRIAWYTGISSSILTAPGILVVYDKTQLKIVRYGARRSKPLRQVPGMNPTAHGVQRRMGCEQERYERACLVLWLIMIHDV